jgi:ATP-dependent DNA helicase RecQ
MAFGGEGISKGLLEDALSVVLPLHFPEIKQLTDLQKDSVLAFVNRRDVFAILPTGYGKSLIFQVICDICEELSCRGSSEYSPDPIVLVVCPLNSLIDSHVRQLQEKGLTAISLVGEAC